MFSELQFLIFMVFFSMILQWTEWLHDSLARILYTLHYDEGLVLEVSAAYYPSSGQFTLSTHLIKSKMPDLI